MHFCSTPACSMQRAMATAKRLCAFHSSSVGAIIKQLFLPQRFNSTGSTSSSEVKMTRDRDLAMSPLRRIILCSIISCLSSCVHAVRLNQVVKGCTHDGPAKSCREDFDGYFKFMGKIQARYSGPLTGLPIETFLEPLWGDDIVTKELAELHSDYVDSDRLNGYTGNCGVSIFFTERSAADFAHRRDNPRREIPGKGWGSYISTTISNALADMADHFIGPIIESEYRAIGITARHCVNKNTYKVVAIGSSDQNEMIGVFAIRSAGYVWDYSSMTDVAVIVLENFRVATRFREKLLQLGIVGPEDDGHIVSQKAIGYLRPRFAAEIGIDFPATIDELPVVAAGWGVTYVKIPKRFRAQLGGKAYYGEDPANDSGLRNELRCVEQYAYMKPDEEGLLLTWAKATKDDGSLGSCAHGDSGGPLVPVGYPNIIIGIVSQYAWGEESQPENEKNESSVYTYMKYGNLNRPSVCVLKLLCEAFSKHIWKERTLRVEGADYAPVGGVRLQRACDEFDVLAQGPPPGDDGNAAVSEEERLVREKEYAQIRKCWLLES